MTGRARGRSLRRAARTPSRWSRTAALASALAGVLLLLLPGAGSASAPPAPAIAISGISVQDGALRFVLGASGFTGAGPDPSTVRVLLDGGSVPAEVSGAAESGTGRTAVLVMDVSLSMRDDISRGVTRFEAAQEAARSFLTTVPDDVRVGLVTFSGEVRVVAEPTTDHGAVAAAVDDLELAADTALYEGVQRGVVVAGDEGSRSLLVLSDGRNDGGGSSLGETTAAITEADVTVDVIGLGEQQDAADLEAMAVAGGGQAVGADQADELAERFDAVAQSISSQLGVSVVLPERAYGRTVTIQAEATVGGQRVADRASYPIDAAPPAADAAPPVAVTVPPAIGSWAAVVALVGVALGVGGLLVAAALNVTKEQTRRARLSRLVGRTSASDQPETVARERERGLRDDAVALADRLLRRRDLDQSLGTRLVAAGVPFRPAEWVLLHAAAALGLALLLLLASGGNPAAAVVGLLVGGLVPWLFLLSRARSRHDAFSSALPETLQTMAASLSAGLTLQQATEAVARDGRPPVSEEVRRALVEVRLGMPLEDALERVAARMGSPDFAWVVMATRIQREVGGNLPELLEVVSSTLRDRDRVRRQGRVLSAEGRISAWVVGLLPIVFACYMLVVRPTYLTPLVTDPFGWAMLLGGVTLFLGGVFWLARLSRIAG